MEAPPPIPPPPPGPEEGAWEASTPAAAAVPQACAACKHQRKKCGPSCPLAPYFPAERAAEFQCVHRVFGVSNVAKRLQNLGRHDRARAAAAMVWEANCWVDGDPVQGAYGRWLRSQQEVVALRQQVEQCTLCRQRSIEAAAAALAPTAIPSTENAYRSSASQLMNRHHAVYDNTRLMVNPQAWPQCVQAQGGLGSGLIPMLLPQEHMMNGLNDQQYYLHDQFQRGP